MSDSRLIATKYIWTAFAASMFFIMTGTFLTGASIGAGHVIMTCAIAIACMVPTIIIWEKAQPAMMMDAQEASQKAKRRNVDHLMDRLSDEERAVLLNRLQEEAVEHRYTLSDDGELVSMRR